MSIETKLRKYILDTFLFTSEPDALANDDSFLEKGIVDSTGIMEIITFIEDEYGFAVEDNELVPENMDSIESLVGYIQNKLSG